MKIQHEYIEHGAATLALFTVSGILARISVKLWRESRQAEPIHATLNHQP